ncbi:MAG: hypothetical protein ABJH57_20940 [Cyclobacteriaceae bacterium]
MTIECLRSDDLISLSPQINHDKAVIEEILNKNNASWYENQKVREYLELYQKLIDRLNQVYDPIPSLTDYWDGFDLVQLSKMFCENLEVRSTNWLGFL